MQPAPREGPRSPGPWTSVSDLAEYAYCPRALWYRHHPPPEPVSAASIRSARRGEEFHRRTLTAVRWREEHRGAIGLALLAGAILLVIALDLAGAL